MTGRTSSRMVLVRCSVPALNVRCVVSSPVVRPFHTSPRVCPESTRDTDAALSTVLYVETRGELFSRKRQVRGVH